MMDDHAVFYDDKEEPLILTQESIQEVLTASGICEEVATKIETSYVERFADAPPVAENLVDSKLLAAHAQRKKEQELEEKVLLLQEKLEEVTQLPAENLIETHNESFVQDKSDDITSEQYDVILRVKPQKVDQIKYEMIDGKKCIVIPMEEDELANVNGSTDLL